MARCAPLRAATLTLALALCASRAPAAHADEGSWTSSALHLKIVMRAIAYDHNLRKQEAIPLRVGVLYDPRSRPSEAHALAIVERMREQARDMTLKRRTVYVDMVRLEEDARLRATLSLGLSILYLVPGLELADVRRVIRVTRDLDVITACGVEAYVYAGVSIGSILRGESPKILINLAASRLEGADLSSQLLQLAEIVDVDATKETP